MSKIKKIIYIKGMHCVSCEMLIKQSSETIEGVKVEYISSNTGIMYIEIPNEQVLPQIEKSIREA
jgi:copper chaperone CopZ